MDRHENNVQLHSTGYRLANFSLRGLTLSSRFLLLFLLARILDPAEMGLYGLLAVTIVYALYLVGFDFYIYSTREIIGLDSSRRGALLKSHLSLLAVLYLIFVPMLTLLFWSGRLPWIFAPWFFVLLMLEHLGQEFSRLLVAVSRPFTAGCVLFLRSGIWVIALAAASLFLGSGQVTLPLVLKFWALGGFLACALGIYSVVSMNMGGWRESVDWVWIRRGLKLAIPYLVATLSLRGIYTLDRYWFESLAGMELLAAYVLFIGIAGTLMSFLESGVFVFQYPLLIRYWKETSPMGFRRESRKLLIQVALLGLVFTVAAHIAIPYLLDWLDRDIYRQNSALFPYLMLATVLFALSMIPHYVLYAQGHDRPLIYSHIVALGCFLLATWILSSWHPVMAVPAALCVTFTVVLLWKSAAYVINTPEEYRMFWRIN